MRTTALSLWSKPARLAGTALALLLLTPIPAAALTYAWTQIAVGAGWSIKPDTLNSNSIIVYMASGTTNPTTITITGTVTNNSGSKQNITDKDGAVFAGLENLTLTSGTATQRLRIDIGANPGGTNTTNILNMGNGNQFTSDGTKSGQPSSATANALINQQKINNDSTEIITITFSFDTVSAGTGSWTANPVDTAVTITFNP